MEKPSIPQHESEIAKIAEFFVPLPDGEDISWLRIEHETGVSMNVKGPGRSFARRALRRLKRPYEPVRGEGLRLSSPDNAMTIVRGRFIRIDGAVRIADRTQQELQKRHLPLMSTQDQQRMLVAAGFFGAIRTIAKETSTKILK